MAVGTDNHHIIVGRAVSEFEIVNLGGFHLRIAQLLPKLRAEPICHIHHVATRNGDKHIAVRFVSLQGVAALLVGGHHIDAVAHSHATHASATTGHRASHILRQRRHRSGGSKHRNKNQLLNHFSFFIFFCYYKINQISLPIQDAIAYWEWIKKAAKHLGECFAAGVMALFLGGMFAYLPSLAWIALLSAS